MNPARLCGVAEAVGWILEGVDSGCPSGGVPAETSRYGSEAKAIVSAGLRL
jgi:hypothetical protein